MATTLIKLKQPVRELELDLDENSLEFMWIPVKDHLPEQNCKVLAAYKIGMFKPRYSMKVVGFAKDLESVDQFDFDGLNEPGFYSYDSEWGYFREYNVTHWMPLPGEPED